MTLLFSIGRPPQSFRMPASFVGAPFEANEFLVVAAVPSLIPRMPDLVLACRRVAVGDAIYGASIAFPFIGLLLAIESIALAPVSVLPKSQTQAFALVGLLVGIACIRRVISIQLAKKMVRKWVAP